MKRALPAIAPASALLLLALLALGGCDGSASGSYTVPPLSPTPTRPTSSGLPSDIPIYPGAQLVGNPSANQATFQVPGDQETISSFYQQHMPQQGWKTGQIQDNGVDGIFLTFTKDTRTVHINISPGSAANQSTLIITVGNQ
jgi:hypothetical protein